MSGLAERRLAGGLRPAPTSLEDAWQLRCRDATIALEWRRRRRETHPRAVHSSTARSCIWGNFARP